MVLLMDFQFSARLLLSSINVIQFYNAQYERGININDPALDIYWKLGSTIPVISEKDLAQPNIERC